MPAGADFVSIRIRHLLRLAAVPGRGTPLATPVAADSSTDRPSPLGKAPFALLVGTVLAVLLTTGVLMFGLPD
jgi:hypothetical protein